MRAALTLGLLVLSSSSLGSATDGGAPLPVAPPAAMAEASPEVAAAVKGAFADYQAALSKKDGKAAVKRIDQASVDYYARMQQAALEADAATVHKLPMVDRMMVLRLRAELKPDALRKLKPVEVIAYGIDHGWVGSNVQDTAVAGVKAEGDVAAAQISVRGRPVPMEFQFRREGGGWRLNLVGLMEIANPAFAAMAQQLKMTEDEFVLFSLEQALGKKVPAEIWDAPRASPAKR